MLYALRVVAKDRQPQTRPGVSRWTARNLACRGAATRRKRADESRYLPLLPAEADPEPAGLGVPLPTEADPDGRVEVAITPWASRT